MIQNGIRKILENHPLIPVVNITNLDEVGPICELLIQRNIGCIELTLRSDVAIDAIKKAKKDFGSKLEIGVGTLINAAQVRTVQEIGVDFLVSPGSSSKLIDAMSKSGIPFIPGVMSPSEIIQGMEMGLNTFKLFPANIAGGLGALIAYKAVFSEVKFCPTGGISQENYKTILDLENVISVGGSWLSK
jgi:2-dehydro-3-deoxyphosphogluconate aldolase/(4S)-4-hydroxy-2-oxoglutarate aldolase